MTLSNYKVHCGRFNLEYYFKKLAEMACRLMIAAACMTNDIVLVSKRLRSRLL